MLQEWLLSSRSPSQDVIVGRLSHRRKAWYYPRTGQTHPQPAARAMPDLQRNELGDFLRSRRESLTPRAVGLTAGQRRRTSGLRRQEVAELAGIGVDWYIRMEQGRAISP